MKNYIKILLTFFIVIMASCTKKETEEVTAPEVFKISDAMMKTTTFGTAKMEVLKNELKFLEKSRPTKTN